MGLRRIMAALAVLLFVTPGPAPAAESRKLRAFESSARAFAAGLSAQRRSALVDARLHYEEALRWDPEFVEAMTNLARVLLAEGRVEEASEWIERALRVRPDYPAIYAVRGLIALANDDAAGALDDFEQARTLVPNDPALLTNLGAAMIQRGLLDEARGVLLAALSLDPDSEAAVLNLALVYDEIGDWARARFHYERYLALASRRDAWRTDVLWRIQLIRGAEEAAAAEEDSREDDDD